MKIHGTVLVRSIAASLLGSIAVTLIISSVIVLWLGRTLTDTDVYISKVGPLVGEEAVQDFTVDKVSEQLIENEETSIQESAAALLGPASVPGKTEAQLRAEIKPVVEKTVRDVISSQAFTDLWVNTNRTAHKLLITQLDSEGSELSLNLRPLITGVVSQLSGTPLAPVQDQIQIDDRIGLVQVEGDQIRQARDTYDNFQRGRILIVLAAVLMTALAVAVSPHHVKTLRRVAFMTGLFAAVAAIGLGAVSWIKPEGTDIAQQELIKTIVEALTGDLRTTLTLIAAVCLVGAAGSKIYEMVMARRQPKGR